jgi:short-subunit dehydrogenase
MPSLTDPVVLITGAEEGLGTHFATQAPARRVPYVPEIQARQTTRPVKADLAGERS